MYDEFCKYLTTLGIPAVSAAYYDSDWISIDVQRISDVQVSKAIAERLSQEIIAHFKSLLKLYNYDGDYEKYEWGTYSVTNIYSRDARYIDLLVRSSKMEIIKKVDADIVPELRPEYMFCYSSSYQNGYFPAGYHVIYSNEDLLKKSEGKVQNQIIDICNTILRKNDIENKYKSEYLKVDFYDKSNCNMYEISRED